MLLEAGIGLTFVVSYMLVHEEELLEKINKGKNRKEIKRFKTQVNEMKNEFHFIDTLTLWKKSYNQWLFRFGNCRFVARRSSQNHLKIVVTGYYKDEVVLQWGLTNDDNFNFTILSDGYGDAFLEVFPQYTTAYLSLLKHFDATLTKQEKKEKHNQKVIPLMLSQFLSATYEEEEHDETFNTDILKTRMRVMNYKEWKNNVVYDVYQTRELSLYAYKEKECIGFKVVNARGMVLCTSVYYMQFHECVSYVHHETVHADKIKEIRQVIQTFVGIKKENSKNEKEKTEIRERTKKQIIYFKDVREKMTKLLAQREWLTDEELHKLEASFPKDLLDMETMFKTLSESGQSDAQNIIDKTNAYVEKEIGELEHQVDKRKIRQLEGKLRVIQER